MFPKEVARELGDFVMERVPVVLEAGRRLDDGQVLEVGARILGLTVLLTDKDGAKAGGMPEHVELRLYVATEVAKLNSAFLSLCPQTVPERFKLWRDTIFPFGGPDNFIDYNIETGILRHP